MQEALPYFDALVFHLKCTALHVCSSTETSQCILQSLKTSITQLSYRRSWDLRTRNDGRNTSLAGGKLSHPAATTQDKGDVAKARVERFLITKIKGAMMRLFIFDFPCYPLDKMNSRDTGISMSILRRPASPSTRLMVVDADTRSIPRYQGVSEGL